MIDLAADHRTSQPPMDVMRIKLQATQSRHYPGRKCYTVLGKLACASAVLLVSISACSSGGKTSLPKTTTTKAVSPPTTTPLVSTTASSATSVVQPPNSETTVTLRPSPQTASTAVGPCITNHLALGYAGSTQGEVHFYVTNAGGGSCTLYGYPDVTPYDSSGHALEPGALHDPSTRPVMLTMAQGQRAGFAVEPSAATQNCVNPAELRVTPPANTAYLTISPHGLQACGLNVALGVTAFVMQP